MIRICSILGYTAPCIGLWWFSVFDQRVCATVLYLLQNCITAWHGLSVSNTSKFYLTVYCYEAGCSRDALHCNVDDITLHYVTMNGRRFVNDRK